MKNSAKAIVVLVATLSVLFALAVSASAAETVKGPTITNELYQFLVTDSYCCIPPAPIKYTGGTVETDDPDGILVPEIRNIDGTLEGMRVYATANNTSRVEGVPTVAGVTFTTNETSYYSIQGNDTVEDFYQDSGHYARRPLTVNLSGVTFKEAGTYRFKIDVSVTANATTVTDGWKRALDIVTPTIYLDVTVKQNPASETKDLMVSGYVFHTSPEDRPTENEKTNGFTIWERTTQLIVDKHIVGNRADKDHFFDFTIALQNFPGNTYVYVAFDAPLVYITGENPPLTALLEPKNTIRNTGYTNSAHYLAEVTDAELAANTGLGDAELYYEYMVMSAVGQEEFANTYGSRKFVYKILLSSAGARSLHFYLSDFDNVLISGIPAGVRYRVSESSSGQNYTKGTNSYNYTSTAECVFGVNEGTTLTRANTSSTALATALTTTSAGYDFEYWTFTNTKEATPQTGLLLDVTPALLSAVVGIACLALIKKRRGRKTI